MPREETCIEFVEHADLDQLYNMPYLYFSYGISTPTGSDTGRIVKEGPQTITIQKGETVGKSILIELGTINKEIAKNIWIKVNICLLPITKIVHNQNYKIDLIIFS